MDVSKMWKNSICRACEGFKNLISIFNDEDNTISTKLMTCTAIDVSHNDGLPQHICRSCINDLNGAFDFKTRCEELDNKFRQLTVDIKLEMDPLLMDIADIDDWTDNNSSMETIKEEQEDRSNKEQIIVDNGSSRVTRKHRQTMKAKRNNQKKTNKLEKEPYKCTACDEMFETHSSMIKHRKTHGNKAFRCNICNIKWFKSSYKMKLHQNIHKKIDETNGFKCEICGKSYVSRTNLLRHMRVHNNDKRYECELCKKSFFQSNTLKDHKITHMLTKDFHCNDCTKAFKTQRHLDKHREIVHQDFIKTNSVPCAICGRMYRSERKLQWHIKQHTQTQTKVGNATTNVPECCASCDVCGKTFKHRALLYIHRRIHTDERPHPCKFCVKRFRNTNDLKYHMNIHTGARPYVCSICSKGFIQPAHLRYHKLVHTGEHPYRCTLCDKAFTSKQSLIIHVRYHTGEKPYTCHICGEGFADPSVLKKHVSRHEPVS